MTKIKAFLRNEDGLVTIEWIGIAAIMLVAAIVIVGFVMEGADAAGSNVATGVGSVGADAAAPSLPTFDHQ